MQCANCGNTLSPASTYCSACGASVAASPPAAGSSQPADTKASQPGTTQQPLRAQTVFYGRYGMRGNLPLPSPSSLAAPGPTSPPAAPPTTDNSAQPSPQAGTAIASAVPTGAVAGASSRPAAVSVGTGVAVAGAGSAPAAAAPASAPVSKPRLAAALPPAGQRPLLGRLIALGATLLLLTMLIGLGVSGYRVYQKNQAGLHATATAAARAHTTATAIARASATASALLFSDSLASNTNGWTEDGTTSFFKGGQYHLHNPDPAMTLNAYYEQQSFSDFRIQVTVTAFANADPNTGVVDAYGLILRADPGNPGDKYAFLVSPAGTYDFERHDATGFYNNGWTDLLSTPWTGSPAIHPGKGATNILAVVARGNTFILLINKQEVAIITDPSASYASGWVGLIVQGADMEAGFSNLQVYGPGL